MEFGLSKSTAEAIQSVFEHYPQIDKVVLYGSRAKGCVIQACKVSYQYKKQK